MKRAALSSTADRLPLLLLLSAAIVLFFPHLVRAGELPRPTGPVLLTVSGKIERVNGNGKAVFDEAMLSSMPWHQIVTSTPWTRGIKRFEGVLLKDVLSEVVAGGDTLLLEGINGYRIEIPLADADEFGVLIALRMDEEPLQRRDKGPLWIVYPRDSIPALQYERYDLRWVWQLNRIDVR